MCFPSNLDTRSFDAAALVATFSADSAQRSLELPLSLSAEQRKQVKRAIDRQPELSCESYGFGKDRRLHLFKVESSVVVKNTFLEAPAGNWSCAQVDPVIFRSMPAQLPTLLQRRKRSSDLELVTEGAQDTNFLDMLEASAGTGERLWPIFRKPPGLKTPDASTLPFRKPPGLKTPDASTLPLRRAVQSMPHGMFGNCLDSEIAAASRLPQGEFRKLDASLPAPPAHVSMVVVPGTGVIIDGLVKMPAFNGQRGTVESFDMKTGRYDILLEAGEHRWVKLKRENLSVMASPLNAAPSVRLSTEMAESARALPLPAAR